MWRDRSSCRPGHDGQISAGSPSASWPRLFRCDGDGERRAIAVWLALFALCSGVTLNRVPIVANSFDEIFFSDPAVNLARGRGLMSYGQFVQPGDSLWVQHPPLYPLLLAGWYRLFGISTFSTRAFGLTCSVVSLWLLWSAMRRSNAVPTAWLRWGVVAVVGLCAGFSNVTRSGRLDVMLQVFLCLGLYGWSLPSPRWRWPLLMASGAAIQLTGLQLDVSLFGFAVVGLIAGGRRFVMQMLPFAIGTVAGLGAFMLWAHWHGVLHYFVQHLTVHVGTPGSGFPDRIRRQLSRLLIADRSYAALLIAEAVATWLLWQWTASRKWLLVSWGIALGVPLVNCVTWERLTTGDAYYYWPIELMAVATLASAWGKACPGGLPGWRSTFIAAPLIVAAVMGAPLRHAAAVVNWSQRDPEPAARLVERHVKPSDVVLVGAGGYYPAARAAAATYTYWYAPRLTAADIARLTLVIMPDDERASFAYTAAGRRCPGPIIDGLGPAWVVIDRIGPAEIDAAMPFFSRPIQLSVLRRLGQ